MMDTPSNTAVVIEELQGRCTRLEQKNAELVQENADLKVKLEWLMEQFRLSKHRQFGASSEKTSPENEQLSFFNEAEAEAKPELAEPTVETITYKRRKRQGHREEMLEGLPEETIEHRLPEEKQVCSICGGPLHEMSTEVHKELEVIPAQVKVVKHVRYIYSCRRCEREEITVPVVTAPAPSPVIPGSLASPSAVAYVASQKYVQGLPLYRQEQELARQGVEISRQTMANWMIYVADRWLSQIYDRLHEHLLKLDVLAADELCEASHNSSYVRSNVM